MYENEAENGWAPEVLLPGERPFMVLARQYRENELMNMRIAREYLNYLKWSTDIGFERVTLLYADRTVPEGSKVVEGIGEIQRRYFTTVDGGRLPLYKILEIRVDGHVVWRRNG